MKTKRETTDKLLKPEQVKQPGNITLSERDYARVAAALADPPKPTPTLVRAMRHYEAQCEVESIRIGKKPEL